MCHHCKHNPVQHRRGQEACERFAVCMRSPCRIIPCTVKYNECKVSVPVACTRNQEQQPFASGVTGVRATMESRVEGLIEMIHDVTDKSVAVGFGISSPEAVSTSLPCSALKCHMQFYHSVCDVEETGISVQNIGCAVVFSNKCMWINDTT